MNDQVAAALDQYPLDQHRFDVRPLGSAGGFSGAQFWRISTPKGDFALRRWPHEYPPPERLQYIHKVLAHAARQGIDCLPVPIPTSKGPSFVQAAGYLWELAPWLPGEANYLPAPSPAKLQAALQALARFHQAAAEKPLVTNPPAIVERFELLMQLNQQSLSEMNRSLEDSIWPSLVEPAKQFLALLPKALMRVLPPIAKLTDVRVPVQPCIRDIWHDHVLFTGERVTGIVDFGAMRADTPAVDIARLLGSLVGDDAEEWQQGLDAYQEVRPLSTDELTCVKALDTSGTVLSGCNWIRWIFVERRQFEHQSEVESRFNRLLVRLRHISETE